ncbi:hypothetical protein [Actinotalea sp. C106]|uniref:hypothetical protein n=1 Tax=Actinotalea sp. C106 TaxID=2908644 RepID=UPI0020289D5C|nr:hypothetical protein [Actinotalea sp. C106]
MRVRVHTVEQNKVEQHKYVVAEPSRPPRGDDLDLLLSRDVTGIAVASDHVAAWLEFAREAIPLRFLEVFGRSSWSLPAGAGDNLEVLHSLAPYKGRLPIASMFGLRSLVVRAASSLEGGLAQLPSLSELVLGSFADENLAILEGCHNLEVVKLTGRGQVVQAGPGSLPASLDYFALHGAYLGSLEAFVETPALRTLIVDVPAPRRARPVLDLRDLRHCRELDWIELWRAARLRGVDVVAGLPRLENLVVQSGNYEPTDVEGLPITVTPATRRHPVEGV